MVGNSTASRINMASRGSMVGSSTVSRINMASRGSMVSSMAGRIPIEMSSVT